MITDPDGQERRRLEGYLPKEEFRANLEMGLGRVAFMKKDWTGAEMRYSNVIAENPDSKFVPEATYYRGVSRYSRSHESSELAATARELAEKFPGQEWQLRSIPWAQH